MRIPEWLRRVGRKIIFSRLAQSLALVALGMIGAFHSARFLGYGGPIDKPPQGLEFLKNLFPMWVYAALWGWAGLICLGAIFFRILTWWGIMSIWGMCTMWTIFYTGGYIVSIVNGRPSAIYYIAGLYLSLSLLPLYELLRLLREEMSHETDDNG